MSKVGLRELATLLAERRKLDGDVAFNFLEAFFGVLNDGLKDEKTVKIKGLGTFKVIPVSARKSVDVNTGEAIELPGREKITFTPDATLRDLVNRPFAQFESVEINEGVDFSDIDAKAKSADEAYDAEEGDVVIPADEDKGAADVPQGIVRAVDDIAQTMAAVDDVPKAEHVSEAEKEPVEAPAEAGSQATEEPEAKEPVQEADPEPTIVAQTEKVEFEPTPEPSVLEPQEEHPNHSMAPTPDVTLLYDTLKSQNEQLADSNEMLREQLEQSHKMLRRLVVAFVVFLLLFVGGAGYLGFQFMQMNHVAPVPKASVPAALTIKPTPRKVVPSTSNEDKKNPDAEVKPENNTQTIESQTKVTADTKPVVEEVQPMTQYNADARVRTGAYQIVGVKTEVKVKAGQTLSSISRFYLGPGMECYVEAMNGIREVSAGQVIKIPEVKLKKK